MTRDRSCYFGVHMPRSRGWRGAVHGCSHPRMTGNRGGLIGVRDMASIHRAVRDGEVFCEER
jgi:hypothetical protein